MATSQPAVSEEESGADRPDAAAGAQAAAIVERVQELQEGLERAPDSDTKRTAEALISALVQMYGVGLEQLLEFVGRSAAGAEELRLALQHEPLLATLLLIHDLHPDTLEQRVSGALEQVRPYMESHGGDVELLSLKDGVARLRLRGSCSDCAASAVTLELAIKQALEQAAPDLEGLEVEGVAPEPLPSGTQLPMASGDGATAGAGFELPMVMPASAPSWRDVEHLEQLAVGELVARQVAGAALVVANVDGTLLAYRDRCAACGEPLHDGELHDGVLRCAGCARTFFLPRAGRSLDDERMQLEPIPLLQELGSVRVALAG